MSELTREAVMEGLDRILHPEFGQSVVQLEMVEGVALSGANVQITLDMLTAASPVKASLVPQIEEMLRGLGGVAAVTTVVRQRSTQPALGGGLLPNVKNVLAIASGKGGVGKSTIATNVAAALALEGASVGLMDADIYGPSVPALLGIEQSSVSIKDKRIMPVERFGLKIMSMGLLMKPGESVIWRGPMLHGMVQQFCKDVQWGDLDFLVIDLPPGTGDVNLSLSQLVPIGGAVVVSTPQHVALGVATKAVNMFRKLNVPLIGLIENMSFYVCPGCGQHDDVFGHGGARQAAVELDLPFLGEVPLNSEVRTAGDKGEPVVISAPQSAPAIALRRAAQLAAGRLAVASVAGYESVTQNVLS